MFLRIVVAVVLRIESFDTQGLLEKDRGEIERMNPKNNEVLYCSLHRYMTKPRIAHMDSKKHHGRLLR
jgi:hypothetical protein